MHNNPNNAIVNRPIYKIHGLERREKKKKLSSLKSLVRNFWHSHQMDKDMAFVYGGQEGYPMSDEKAAIMFEKLKKDMEVMQLLLDEKLIII